MRELKYRVWGVDINGEGERKMWFVPDIRDTDTSRRVFSELEDNDVMELNPWMQYTGLKDKNGVEIYEGDIFNCMYHSDGHTDHVYTVEYYEQGTKFLLRRYGNKCPQNGVVQTVSDVARYGVIGNIWENPELLGANQ